LRPGDAALVDELLEISVEAAKEAAGVIRDSADALGTLEWVEKAAMDFVTEVDRGAESAIIATIKREFPQSIFVGEETSPDADVTSAGITFIIDPLDGTTNFLHAYPHFAVSIGVMHQSRLVAAVVLNVPRGDLFTARLGSGTQLNGSNVTVSSTDSTSRALIGTGFPFKNPDLLERYAGQFIRVSRETAGIRRAGSAALDLADVACGRFDGFWELVLAPWDVAAGMLLVTEAGGVITDLGGSPASPRHGAYVAGNPLIHPWLLQTVQGATET
jgi:myo-inositol-1(or 4)-monophosphatase